MNNNLSLFAPMDSGAAQVAHYGGFGMPTVVLLGGASHRVMFSTLNFTTADTTIMRDSILRLIGVLIPAGVAAIDASNTIVKCMPNPANSSLQVQFELTRSSAVQIHLLNVLGQQIAAITPSTYPAGLQSVSISTSTFQNGVYFLETTINGKSDRKKIIIAH
jgi:hypothetical protein